MNLKEIIERKEAAINNKGDNLLSPQRDIPCQPIEFRPTQEKPKNKNKYLLIIISIIATILIALLVIIYVPQFFMSDTIDNNAIVDIDKSMIEVRKNYIIDNLDSDFDSDGLSNKEEIENIDSFVYKTNPYIYDCDFDGISDKNDAEPKKKDEDIYNKMKENDITTKTAYKMDNVIMWAKDKDSLAYGGVIKMKDGSYRFSNFDGWAKFPNGKYAYKYENGIHTLLKYKESDNAWRIDGDYTVVLTDEKPSEVNLFSFFDKKIYLKDNWFNNFIEIVLPNKGLITCNKMWLDDTFIDISIEKSIKFNDIKYDNTDYSRFSSNDISLERLSSVYKTIDAGEVLLVSLFNEDKGEAIMVVSGYFKNGDLLLSSLDNGKQTRLSIYPQAAKELNNNNNIVQRQWFEFFGAGFNSKDNDTIHFFTPSKEIATDTDTDVKAEAVTTDTDTSSEQEESVTPQNGVFVNGDKTYYYIDGLPVINNFVRVVNDKCELCSIKDSGAFYVNNDGLKATGNISIDGKTYMYYNDRFYFNCVLAPSGNTYQISNASMRNTIYVNSEGYLQSGWVTISGYKYYLKNGTIQRRCFVKNESGKYRYLNVKGIIATDCLMTLDKVEIMFDKNGNIINEDYAINIIKAYYVS